MGDEYKTKMEKSEMLSSLHETATLTFRKASKPIQEGLSSNGSGHDDGLRLVASKAISKAGVTRLGPCCSRRRLTTAIARSIAWKLAVALDWDPRTTEIGSLLVPTTTSRTRT